MGNLKILRPIYEVTDTNYSVNKLPDLFISVDIDREVIELSSSYGVKKNVTLTSVDEIYDCIKSEKNIEKICIAIRTPQMEAEKLINEVVRYISIIRNIITLDKEIFILFIENIESGNNVSVGSLMGSVGKSLNLLAPGLKTRYLLTDVHDARNLSHIIFSEYAAPYDSDVRYIRQKKYIMKKVPATITTEKEKKLTGVILISGGMGKLSSDTAEYLLEHTNAIVILVGRRELDKKLGSCFYEHFAKYGDRAGYISADVCDREKLFTAYNEKCKGMQLCGVIHAAGINDGKFIVQKSIDDMINTLNVKIIGTNNLSELAENNDASFFISFSSLSAYDGDFVQSDYSSANSYLNRFSEIKTSLNSRCRYTSVCWPLFRDGGMHLSNDIEKLYLDHNKYLYLEHFEAMPLIYDIIYGNTEEILILKKLKEDAVKMNDILKSNIESINSRISDFIFDLTNIRTDKLDMELGFGELGFDSITFNDFAKLINSEYHLNITPIDFFTLTTPNKLVRHISSEMKSENISKTNHDSSKHEEDNFGFADFEDLNSPSYDDNNMTENDTTIFNEAVVGTKSDINEPIAIVGIDCIMPDAENKEEYWDNLLNGKCSVKDIPSERQGEAGGFEKNTVDGYQIRACFIDKISEFDEKFFHMMPKECEYMDPQQRLYIQVVWNALEDAGYDIKRSDNRNVGVFSGVQHSDYRKLLSKNDIIDSSVALGNEPPMISNIISYMFDFKGPSVSVNTACSSSLVALHDAVRAIQNNECDMAVAGGVCIYLSTDSFAVANKMGILSDYCECRALDDSAAGYVKGEGIGAVVLKPLSAAVRDNDNIYCVIKGVLVAHGGHAQSVASPRSDSQADLLSRVMKISGVSPDEISYAELHGTGTHLGDPVEIEAMKTAYSGVKNGSCYIGSVKNNIGHLEPASGIASVIKTALCLVNKKIPPHINYRTENRFLKLSESPFTVNTEVVDLKNKVRNGRSIPLIASVSSFGFGGTNCNIILEEYSEKVEEQPLSEKNIFVLSAMSDERLELKIRKYVQFIKSMLDEKPEKKIRLFHDLCYSLQCRRTVYSNRFSVVCDSIEDLYNKINSYLQNRTDPDVMKGDSDETSVRFSDLFDDNGAKNYITFLKKEKNYNKIAAFWVMGMSFEWDDLFKKGKNISLPSEPLLKKRFWFDSYKEKKNNVPGVIGPDLTVESDELVKLYYVDDNIGVLTLIDKKNKNMFSDRFVDQLSKCLEAAAENKALKALIVTGYDNIFCMGGSKKELLDLQAGKSTFSDSSVIYKGLLSLNIPVITAMQGSAFGGGLCFGLYGDIVIMAEEAFYSANFMRYGFTPGLGSTYILKQKFGENLANYMMFSADVITGKEIAQKNGSVIVKKAADVLSSAVETARRIAGMDKEAISFLKSNVSGIHLYMLEKTIENELEMHSKTMVRHQVFERIHKYFIDSSDDEKNIEHGKSEDVKPLELKRAVNMGSSSAGEKVELSSIEKNTAQKKTARADKKSDTKIAREFVASTVAEILHIDLEDVNMEASLTENGIDSIYNIEFVKKLNSYFNAGLDITDVYEYSTLNDIADSVYQKKVNDKIVLTAVENSAESPVGNKKEESIPKQELKDLTAEITELLCDVLHIDREAADYNTTFSDLGMDSINLIEFTRNLNRKFGLILDTSDLYDYNCVSLLNKYIVDKQCKVNDVTAAGIPQRVPTSEKDRDNDILALLNSINTESDISEIDDFLRGLI